MNDTPPDVQEMATALAHIVSNECFETDDENAVLMCRVLVGEEDDGEEEEHDTVLWHVLISPAPAEIFGGPDDGKKALSKFSIDIMPLLYAFEETHYVNWNAHPRSEEEHANLMLYGEFPFKDHVYRVVIEFTSHPITGDNCETQIHFRMATNDNVVMLMGSGEDVDDGFVE